jgi:putative endonuclease
MPSKKRQFGDTGENEAGKHLANLGYKIKERNYRVKNYGEIDLVAEKGGKLIFFEVKTRDIKHEGNFPIGFSINEKKRRNLKRICQIYITDKKIPLGKSWQVDAIFIKVDLSNDHHSIEHLENILWEKYY